jgi:hypothetical protein
MSPRSSKKRPRKSKLVSDARRGLLRGLRSAAPPTGLVAVTIAISDCACAGHVDGGYVATGGTGGSAVTDAASDADSDASDTAALDAGDDADADAGTGGD